MGDMCGIPLGKTGGSARHHGPVAAMEGKKLKEKFDGYRRVFLPLNCCFMGIIIS